jgi:hypothetical protein
MPGNTLAGASLYAAVHIRDRAMVLRGLKF